MIFIERKRTNSLDWYPCRISLVFVWFSLRLNDHEIERVWFYPIIPYQQHLEKIFPSFWTKQRIAVEDHECDNFLPQISMCSSSNDYSLTLSTFFRIKPKIKYIENFLEIHGILALGEYFVSQWIAFVHLLQRILHLLILCP